MTDDAAFRVALVRRDFNQPTAAAITVHGLLNFNYLVVTKQASTITDLMKAVVASRGPPDAGGQAAPAAPYTTIVHNVNAEAHLSAWVK